MPNHMAQPAMGAPYRDCIWKVNHRKAPGAIRAIAFIVRPVRPSVPLVGGCSFAMVHSFQCCLKGAPLTLPYSYWLCVVFPWGYLVASSLQTKTGQGGYAVIYSLHKKPGVVTHPHIEGGTARGD